MRRSRLAALNPSHALNFALGHGTASFVVLGSVLLAVTGAEALYADVGHFGTRAVRLAWFAVAAPALVLNYFGQGALLIAQPAAIENPFYLAFPAWALYPMVALATAATVIASQATISGAYSLTRQAIQLGYLPRMTIVHTSARTMGQIYVPAVNWILLVAVIAAVVTVDLVFFAAAAHKILDGGWFPLALAVLVFAVMLTWRRGRERMRVRLRDASPPLPGFLQALLQHPPQRTPGTAVFLTASRDVTPNALLHSLKHYKVLHERNVFLTVQVEDVPFVAPDRRIGSEKLAAGCWRVTTRYGFMEQPDVTHALELWTGDGTPAEPMEVSYFLSREKIVAGVSERGFSRWRDRLFAAMARNASSVTDFFNIPANRVVELGTRVEI